MRQSFSAFLCASWILVFLFSLFTFYPLMTLSVFLIGTLYEHHPSQVELVSTLSGEQPPHSHLHPPAQLHQSSSSSSSSSTEWAASSTLQSTIVSFSSVHHSTHHASSIIHPSISLVLVIDGCFLWFSSGLTYKPAASSPTSPTSLPSPSSWPPSTTPFPLGLCLWARKQIQEVSRRLEWFSFTFCVAFDNKNLTTGPPEGTNTRGQTMSSISTKKLQEPQHRLKQYYRPHWTPRTSGQSKLSQRASVTHPHVSKRQNGHSSEATRNFKENGAGNDPLTESI